MKKAVLLLLAGAAACHSKEPAAEQAPAPRPPAQVAARPQGPEVQAAIGYYRWYARNSERLNKIQLVDGGSTSPRDTGNFYAVDFKGTERYLAALRKSGYVSPVYLADWRAYFRRQNDSLRLHPQNDGPPAGFEFDLVVHSQEPDEYLQHIAQVPLRMTHPTPTRALVVADFTRPATPDMPDNNMPDKRLFYLQRYATKWLIDSIGVE
jgi:hypothetical protein